MKNINTVEETIQPTWLMGSAFKIQDKRKVVKFSATEVLVLEKHDNLTYCLDCDKHIVVSSLNQIRCRECSSKHKKEESQKRSKLKILNNNKLKAKKLLQEEILSIKRPTIDEVRELIYGEVKDIKELSENELVKLVSLAYRIKLEKYLLK